MANPRIPLTLAGVFLAGMGTGMIGMRYGLHEHIHPSEQVLQAPANPEALLKYYRTQLKLSAEQTKKLAAVLADYQRYYEVVQDQIDQARLRDQIEDLRSTGKSRILEILNPEQREQFEKMIKLDPARSPASE